VGNDGYGRRGERTWGFGLVEDLSPGIVDPKSKVLVYGMNGRSSLSGFTQ
jgi:hypothetical protein